MTSSYAFPLERFCDGERFEKIRRFSNAKETPFLLIEPALVGDKYRELKENLPFATIYYAMKANPTNEILALLRELGSNFDVATRYELDQLLSLGVSPERMSFGNTIKKEADIAYFRSKGIGLFVTDSMEDVEKIARAAPGAKVFFRVLTEGSGADWPLSRKFGASPDVLLAVMLRARELGLVPWGVSFHVGSQQRDIKQWDAALSSVKGLFDRAKAEGIVLSMINLGGGLPANYIEPTQGIAEYAATITGYLHKYFGKTLPEIIIEPGRSIAADSGIIVAEIVLISKKTCDAANRWVYLDVGKFGGLIETLDEALHYPVCFTAEGPQEEVIIAGPTCDSMDILYESRKYPMPSTAAIGDRVYIFTTGAYTQSYSSVYFNGFPPLKSYILE
jgi:ornithine decarboxylase